MIYAEFMEDDGSLTAVRTADWQRLVSSPAKEETEGHRLTAGCDFSAGGDESVMAVRIAGALGLVRGDLDWITMKALEKDRTRRYEQSTSVHANSVR